MKENSKKYSQYTLIFEEENGCVIYNGYTGAVAVLDEENIDLIVATYEGKKEVGDIPLALLEQLEYGGFIVGHDYDERRRLASGYGLKNYQLNTIASTVVITEECNFACPYCYQIEPITKGCIEPHVVKSYLAWVNEQAEKGLNRSMLTLYGGEPLLYPEVCREIAHEFRRIAEKHGNNYITSMVTNGYLLDKNVAWIKECNIDNIQITIDGPKEVHNKRRLLKNRGKDTYETIVSNCLIAANNGIHIKIRVNVDELVTKQVTDERLRHENISLYYEPTRYDHCGDVLKYYENQKYMYEVLKQQERQQLSHEYINARLGGCLATAFNSFVLLPDGGVVKCWDEISEPGKVPSIRITDKDFLQGLYQPWANWNPYLDIRGNDCYECKLLPNCGGGCPYRAINGAKDMCQLTEETLRSIVYSEMRIHK